jgi:predicted membrane protein
MVIIPATVFTSPIITNTSAIATVTSVALKGSLVSPLPFSRTLFTLLEGKEWSPASA